MISLKIIATAIASSALTSAFWIVAYNGPASHAPDQIPGSTLPAQHQQAAAAVASLPPGQTVTATAVPGAPAQQLVVAPSGLAIPVAGIAARDLVDTYTQSRAGGARVHNAIDIMAARGTPVIAAAPGRVEKLFFSNGGGGITAYVRSDDGQWMYYYAHLDRYAPGLAEGQRVERGAPIGFVGSTGNASVEGPHLHFAVYRMAPGQHWSDGTPVNPYPMLAGGH